VRDNGGKVPDKLAKEFSALSTTPPQPNSLPHCSPFSRVHPQKGRHDHGVPPHAIGGPAADALREAFRLSCELLQSSGSDLMGLTVHTKSQLYGTMREVLGDEVVRA
jgi:hypothetical protein